MLASAGFDREVFLWDIEAARTQSCMPYGGGGDISFQKASGHHDSIYCLSTNAQGSVVVSGSTERVSTYAVGLLRIWDPRTGEKVWGWGLGVWGWGVGWLTLEARVSGVRGGSWGDGEGSGEREREGGREP